MSSWRNAVKSKEHKERSQPIARQSLGLLEKKKDYKIRAEESHKRNKLIQNLKLQAALKNPDEFNTHMITLKKVRGNGVYITTRVEKAKRNGPRNELPKRKRTRCC